MRKEELDAQFKRQMLRNNLAKQLNAPQGALVGQKDEESVSFNLTARAQEGIVELIASRAFTNVGIAPDQARALGILLIEHAFIADRKLEIAQQRAAQEKAAEGSTEDPS